MRRSEAELVYLLLETAKRGADKRLLVKASGLPNKSAERHITMIIKRGLLSERHGLFFVSEKGKNFLSEFRKYRELQEEYLQKLRAVRELMPHME